MNFETFSEGYKSALHNLERYMEASINRNNGARTTQGAINVLNDTIVYIHQELQSVSNVDTEEEETRVSYEFESVEDVFEAILKDLTGVLNTKGGIQ